MPQGNLQSYQMSDPIAPHQMPVPPPGQGSRPGLSQNPAALSGLAPGWALQKIPVEIKADLQQSGDTMNMSTNVPPSSMPFLAQPQPTGTNSSKSTGSNMGQQLRHVLITQSAAGGPQQVIQLPAAQQQALQALHLQQHGQVRQQVPLVGNVAPAGSSAPMISSNMAQQQIPVDIRLPIAQQLQLLQQQQAAATIAPSGPSLGLKPINTQLPSVSQPGHLPLRSMAMPSMPSNAGLIFGPGDNQIPQQSLRAAQLARYRQKKMNRMRALAEGQKKIRYACRKTLADARPRVKGRFAKVHGSPVSSPKESKDKLSKLRRSTVTRSAVDLKQLEQMALQQPKMQESLDELDDIKGMWWLNDDIGNDDKANAAANSLMDDIVDSEVRRCYSETNLFQFDSIDVQAALDVLHTEQTFNSICVG